MYYGTHLYKFIHTLYVELSPWTPMRGQMSNEMMFSFMRYHLTVRAKSKMFIVIDISRLDIDISQRLLCLLMIHYDGIDDRMIDWFS